MQRFFVRLRLARLTGRRVGIAFSGGSDSTALALAAREAATAGKLRPWLLHVQHGMRPDDGNDVPTLLATAECLSLPITSRRLPPEVGSRHPGAGVEEAYRRERYGQLLSMIDHSGAEALLTGHHADDQAETLILHLVRGAGPSGAHGMPADRKLSIPWWSNGPQEGLRVVRPLLEIRRADLREFVNAAQLPVIDDPSNQDLDRSRSVVRERILPAMEEINPAAAEALSRFAMLSARAAVGASEQSQNTGHGTSVALDVGMMGSLAESERLELVRAWLLERGVRELTFERTRAVVQLATGRGNARIELPGGHVVAKRRGRLVWESAFEENNNA